MANQASVVTLDVLAATTRREASSFLRQERKASVLGRTLLGAHYTFRGHDLHAPWPRSLAGRRPNHLKRIDGWGTITDLHRVFVATAWRDVDALNRYETTRGQPQANEHWHARLLPIRSTGTIGGADPVTAIARVTGPKQAPGVVVTYADVPLRNLLAFYRYLIRAAEAQHASPGALSSFATGSWHGGHFHGFTISCWKRLDDALAFAYRGAPHRSAIAWSESARGQSVKFWFGRFALEASKGTLAGRDPFIAAGSGPQIEEQPALELRGPKS